jgi:hypothetical protein
MNELLNSVISLIDRRLSWLIFLGGRHSFCTNSVGLEMISELYATHKHQCNTCQDFCMLLTLMIKLRVQLVTEQAN